MYTRLNTNVCYTYIIIIVIIIIIIIIHIPDMYICVLYTVQSLVVV